MKLVLVRHAQAESNLVQLVGRNNHVALTEAGGCAPSSFALPPLLNGGGTWPQAYRKGAVTEAGAVLAQERSRL